MTARISVVTPVFDPPLAVLEETIASVRAQTFSEWEWCVVDDASKDEAVRDLLRRAAASEPRIRLHEREHNGGIVQASNTGLAMATGEIVVLLDHDDLLAPHALARVAEAFRDQPELDYLYSDEAYLDEDGRSFFVFCKPDWSPERFRAQMYTCHLSAARRSLVEEVGGFREGFDGSQDYDLVLRLTERARRIGHLPEVLYKWRMTPASVLGNAEAKPYAYEAGRRALEEHCQRVGIDATVEHRAIPGTYRVRRQVRDQALVSIIIPTRGSSGRVWGAERVFVTACVRSIIERTTYRHYEIVIVADTSTPLQVIAEIRELCGDRLRLVWWDKPFNFASKVNLGAYESSGQQLLLLNDDIEVVSPDWIEEMLGLVQEPDVGLVGARLLLADGRLQHAGHVYDGDPHHIFFHRGSHEAGPASLLQIPRECSGVTAACLMVSKTVYEDVGGMTTGLPSNFNDVDLSLKVRAKGLRVIWTPDATLYHFESQTRDSTVGADELAFLRSRWSVAMSNDPYWNEGLVSGRNDWLVRPTRSGLMDRVG